MAPGKTSAKAKAKAKGQQSKTAEKRMSPKQAALQKVRENFKLLPEHCKYVKISPATQRTLPQQVEYDITLKRAGGVVPFGKSYYRDLTHVYSPDNCAFVALKPDPADPSVVTPGCLKANIFKLSVISFLKYYVFNKSVVADSAVVAP